jgi:predicted acyl esterase
MLVLAVGGSVAGSTAGAQGSTPAVPDFLRYDRPATFSALAEQVSVPMRDGVGLRCALRRPGRDATPAEGRFPGLVTNFFAYRALQEASFGDEAKWFSERGYVTLMCSPRGSGGSPGQWRPFRAQEQQDNYDLIEWLAAQPWSTGKVGQTGASYGGISTYRVVATRPPHLTAAAPIVSYSRLYDEIVYPGGIRGSILRWWPSFTWATAIPGEGPAGILGGFADSVAFERDAAAHPTYDDYWREADIDTAAVDASQIPVLGLGGWHDLFPRGMVANYEAARDQSWLVMFPWAHSDVVPGNPNYGPADNALLAWFDHWLLDLPGAPLPSTRVTSWELPKRRGRWVALPDYPAAPSPETLFLNADGTLAGRARTAGAVTYTVNPFDTGCACADHGMSTYPDDPANDQQAADQARTHFDSAALAQDTVIAGAPLAHLRASLSASDGNLVVRLEDVAADGASAIITTGWLRASHRQSHEHPEALHPGQTYDYDVHLWPTHWRVAAGHHLRVSLSSGDVAAIEPNAPPGTVTILTGTGGSVVELPVASS